MSQSMEKPNCAPTWEYVAIPLGSSSAAPVTGPGPSLAKSPSCSDAVSGAKEILVVESSAVETHSVFQATCDRSSATNARSIVCLWSKKFAHSFDLRGRSAKTE